ncbi:teneurin-2-like [Hoplias malabaricus]|uniref:teneurin-2-like n=1 Tax=Hoplias malabaricus TaxID=27720 RepID=UPI00346288C8
MDMKDRRHRSLTRGRCRKELHYATSSMDTDECHVDTQKSYNTSETLRAYEQDPGRLRYGGCVAELVHHETEEYVRQGSFTLAELGVCERPQQQSVYCSDLSLVQRGYSLSTASDADSDPEAAMTPERAVQLWSGQGLKSCRSSGLSSPDHSALTLTDSENEHKTDDESVYLALQSVWSSGAFTHLLPSPPPHTHPPSQSEGWHQRHGSLPTNKPHHNS